jgi:hypothetical protein
MKPRPDLRPDEKQAFVDAFKRAVREIPAIRGVRLGRRITHGAGYETAAPDGADFLAILDFDDVHALQTYLLHPAHDELGRRFGQALASATVYDFELADLDALAK